MNPYRFHQFYMPTHAPFDKLESSWLTFVGKFIAPIVKDEKDLIYWFCNHSGEATPNYQFCFVADDFKKIETKIEKEKSNSGIKTFKAPPTDMERLEFAGKSRWLATNKIGDPAVEDKRAELVLRSLHCICALLIDQLVSDGDYWKLEENVDTTENPLGNSFESILHLISNISGAQFDVQFELSARTIWSQPYAGTGALRSHL